MVELEALHRERQPALVDVAGVALGAGIGAALDDIAFGMCIGIALGCAIALGLCAAFGTLMPPLVRVLESTCPLLMLLIPLTLLLTAKTTGESAKSR